jgi:hypothetical protein
MFCVKARLKAERMDSSRLRITGAGCFILPLLEPPDLLENRKKLSLVEGMDAGHLCPKLVSDDPHTSLDFIMHSTHYTQLIFLK